MSRGSVVWIKCSHDATTDYCWECSPYWIYYPVCSDCKSKVNNTTPRGKRGYYCRKCKKYLEDHGYVTDEIKTFRETFPDYY